MDKRNEEIVEKITRSGSSEAGNLLLKRERLRVTDQGLNGAPQTFDWTRVSIYIDGNRNGRTEMVVTAEAPTNNYLIMGTTKVRTTRGELASGAAEQARMLVDRGITLTEGNVPLDADLTAQLITLAQSTAQRMNTDADLGIIPRR